MNNLTHELSTFISIAFFSSMTIFFLKKAALDATPSSTHSFRSSSAFLRCLASSSTSWRIRNRVFAASGSFASADASSTALSRDASSLKINLRYGFSKTWQQSWMKASLWVFLSSISKTSLRSSVDVFVVPRYSNKRTTSNSSNSGFPKGISVYGNQV